MTKQNKIIIQKAVGEAGNFLKGKLKPTKEIPNRNAYAHIWKEIKLSMGCSYKDCSDDDVQEILGIIELIKGEI